MASIAIAAGISAGASLLTKVVAEKSVDKIDQYVGSCRNGQEKCDPADYRNKIEKIRNASLLTYAGIFAGLILCGFSFVNFPSVLVIQYAIGGGSVLLTANGIAGSILTIKAKDGLIDGVVSDDGSVSLNKIPSSPIPQ